MKQWLWLIVVALVLASVVSPAVAGPKPAPKVLLIGVCMNVPPICITVPLPFPPGERVLPGNPGGVAGSKQK